MIENVEKHSKDIILTDWEDEAKATRSGLYQKTDDYYGEDETLKCFVVTSLKSKVKDKIPSHIGSSILMWSKLLFLR